MSSPQSRKWYQGWSGLWLKEAGPASYFVPSIFATIFSPLFIGSEPVILNLLAMFAIICIYASLALQSIRLQATEWQALVVDYCQHVTQQGKVFIAIINGFMLINAAIEQSIHLLSTIFVANTLGLGLWLLCRVSSHLFTLGCYIIFTTGIISCVLLEKTPIFLIPIAIVTYLVLLVFRDKFGQPYHFSSHAFANYRHGVQSGWSPVPVGFLSSYSKYLNKQLFPLSYFVGPSLSQFTILLVGLSASAIIINFFYDISKHSMFSLTNVLLALFTLCQWSRSQRTQSWELLYTLPIYNSTAQAKSAFIQSALKFTIYVGIFCFIVTLPLIGQQQWQYVYAANFSLTACAAFLASFIIGNIVKNTSIMGILLCFSYGGHMALSTYIIQSDNGFTDLVLVSLYVCSLALLNRFSAKYL